MPFPWVSFLNATIDEPGFLRVQINHDVFVDVELDDHKVASLIEAMGRHLARRRLAP